jgi:ribosomal protein L12E/L44/L45/RPP1/RPP2
VKAVVTALQGKNLEEVIAEGSKKTQSLSFGGGSAPAPVAAKAADAKAPAAKEAPKAKEPEPVVEVTQSYQFRRTMSIWEDFSISEQPKHISTI